MIAHEETGVPTNARWHDKFWQERLAIFCPFLRYVPVTADWLFFLIYLSNLFPVFIMEHGNTHGQLRRPIISYTLCSKQKPDVQHNTEIIPRPYRTVVVLHKINTFTVLNAGQTSGETFRLDSKRGVRGLEVKMGGSTGYITKGVPPLALSHHNWHLIKATHTLPKHFALSICHSSPLVCTHYKVSFQLRSVKNASHGLSQGRESSVLSGPHARIVRQLFSSPILIHFLHEMAFKRWN